MEKSRERFVDKKIREGRVKWPGGGGGRGDGKQSHCHHPHHHPHPHPPHPQLLEAGPQGHHRQPTQVLTEHPKPSDDPDKRSRIEREREGNGGKTMVKTKKKRKYRLLVEPEPGSRPDIIRPTARRGYGWRRPRRQHSRRRPFPSAPVPAVQSKSSFAPPSRHSRVLAPVPR